MGQAKARQEREQTYARYLANRVDLSRLAKAMQKLATAASSSLGGDCYVHATLAGVILAELGIQNRLTIGFAGWRVGDGDGDVILHAPTPQTPIAAGSGRCIPFHAWLSLGDADTAWILDFSTYQLPRKAAELDAADGATTAVNWKPDYLLIPATRTVTRSKVTNGKAGMCYYEENGHMTRLVMSEDNAMDRMDLSTLRFLYEHPDVEVLGPNDNPYLQRQHIRGD